MNFAKNDDFIEISLKKSAINELKQLILGHCPTLNEVIFVSDEKIIKNSWQYLTPNFLDDFTSKLIFKKPYASLEFVKKIKNKAQGKKLIIGFGSGTINDLCKISAKELGINYIIIASAASMNGYLSKNASILVNGHKKTLPAICPKIVIADINIIKNAPKKTIRSGIGDSLCFYSCWFDWYLSHKILGTKFDVDLFLQMKAKIDYLIKNYHKFDLKDEKLIKLLMEILFESGWSMTLAGGSYPASQSEHLISHVMEMKYHDRLKNQLHGQQIALTSLVSSKLQKNILEVSKLRLKNNEFDFAKISRFFNKDLATQLQQEYSKKQFRDFELEKINKNLEKDWQEIRQDLQKIYLTDVTLRKIFRHFKIEPFISRFNLSQAEFNDCIYLAKFIRDRFTCLDLL